MSDLILRIPNHGYSISDVIFVSWLNANFYIRDADNDPSIAQNSFKISTDDSDNNIVPFTETITEGFVREVDTSAEVTIITGLEHLEGETVKLTSSGAVITTEVVSSGSITLPINKVSTYAVGKNYISTLQPMDLDIEGTGLSTTKRIHKVFVDLDETIGGTVGPSMDNQENIPTGSSPFTGFKEISYPGGYSRDTDITIRQPEPLPMTVLSITYELGASND